MLTLRGPQGVRRGASLADPGIISDGAVLVHDGRIVSVGSTRRLENLRESQRAIEVPVHGKVLMPAFVDVNQQLSLKRFGDGNRQKTVADFFEDSLTLMRSCLHHGTATVQAHAGGEGDTARSDPALMRKLSHLRESPLRLLRTWQVKSLPDKETAATLKTLLRRKLIDAVAMIVDASGEIDWAFVESLREVGLPLRLLWSSGPVELLRDVLDRLRPTVVCPSQPLTAEEAALLAEGDVITAFPVDRRAFEPGRILSARILIDRGGALALTSGYHSASAPTFNMQMVVALAVARLGLTVGEAITASTVNAACALGCAHLTGSIEVGRVADLVVLNVSDIAELPVHFGFNNVAMMFRGGNLAFNRTRWRAPSDAADNRVRSKSL